MLLSSSSIPFSNSFECEVPTNLISNTITKENFNNLAITKDSFWKFEEIKYDFDSEWTETIKPDCEKEDWLNEKLDGIIENATTDPLKKKVFETFVKETKCPEYKQVNIVGC